MHDKRVVVINNKGEVYVLHNHVQKGCTVAEAKKLLSTNSNFANAKIYFIEDEIKKYNLKGDEHLRYLIGDEEIYQYSTWITAFNDRNIHVTSLPIDVPTNSAYEERLFQEIDIYLQALQKPAFVYNTELIDAVTKNCETIKAIFVNLKNGKQSEAENLLKGMLAPFTEDNPFLCNELGKSYAFKGLAPFLDLHMSGWNAEYEKMMKTDLTFFRSRTKSQTKSDEISTVEHILHVPYDKRNYAREERYSKASEPCLYLGVTSFVCAEECGWKHGSKDDMYTAIFVPNEYGKQLKILNLAFSQHLINGLGLGMVNQEIELKIQSDMLKLYPLLLATSFTVKEDRKCVKYEYLISQCLIKVLHEIGIDGVAYLSARGEDEFQYPQGVNLALLAYDISDKKQFSKYCSMFEISRPVKFLGQENTEYKSYINEIYKEYMIENEFKSFASTVSCNGQDVFYGDTDLGKFDNYLCSLERETISF